ncbi:hypothetical protein, partial [Escherichia coli]|uniref:hypothetical protein n=1 Tax=Escherichia coli TaxID=562 RepID=UPI003D02C57F
REVVLRRAARSDDSMPSQREFGLEAITESFLYRAWLRADIGFDPEAPPSARYRLAMRGDQDFWRSFVIRTRLGYHRHLVHALVEFQYPDG